MAALEWILVGHPERFAQQALGHNSKAIHAAYSRNAEVTVPSLDDWEKQWNKRPVGSSQCSAASPGRTEDGGQKTYWEMPKAAVVQVDFQVNGGEPSPTPDSAMARR